MSTIETYTGKSAADARAGSSSWSELMKELWESDPNDPRAPLEGDSIDDPAVREAIGRARAVTLPDGQVWTAANGVNLWREGPAAGLIQHWEKGRSAEGGLLGRVFRGELENSGRVQDTFEKNGPPKEWSQLRFTFSPADLAALAGSGDRAAMVEAARDLTRTIHDALHRGARDGTRMVVSGPVHLDTATPHVDFWVHHFEIDTERGDVIGQANLGKTSTLRDEVLRIRTAVRDRHGFDFDGFKANGRMVDLPWDMPRSKDEREALTARQGDADAPEASEAPASGEAAPAARPAAQPIAPAFRRPIAAPELVQVQQYAKAAAREAEAARKALEDAEAREEFARHVESAFIAAEEAKAERDAATERAEKAEANAAEAIAERDDIAGQLAAATDTLTATTAERDGLAGELKEASDALALTSQHLEQAETRAKRVEGERDEQASRADKAEADLAGVQDELRERTDELAGVRAELESERAETAAAIEDRDRLAAELATVTTRAEAVEAERDQVRAALAQAQEAVAAERAEAAIAAKESERLADALEASRGELETVRAALAAAQAEAEQARAAAREAAAERAGLASSLDAIRAALATTEGALASERNAHTALKEAAAEAEEADAIPPGGTGLDGVAIDRRRRDPSAAWPAGTEYRKGLFGRARIMTGDGATLRVQRGAVRLAGGSLTPDAVAAMIVHAQREGWVPIAVSGDEKTRAALAEAARAAGLTLEGEEPGLRPTGRAPAAPAQAPAAPPATAPAVQQGRPQPSQTFRTKAPGGWTKAERDAAGRAFLSAQDQAREKPEGDRGRMILNMTLEDWGKAVHDRWRKEHPEANGDGDKPKTPKP